MCQRVDAIKHFPADHALTEAHGIVGEVSVGEDHNEQLANPVFPHNRVPPTPELAPRGLRQMPLLRHGNFHWTPSSIGTQSPG